MEWSLIKSFSRACLFDTRIVFGHMLLSKKESLRIQKNDFWGKSMTRFEESYNPTILYDPSCRIKEYGLNREVHKIKIFYWSRHMDFKNYMSALKVFTAFHNMKKWNQKHVFIQYILVLCTYSAKCIKKQACKTGLMR